MLSYFKDVLPNLVDIRPLSPWQGLRRKATVIKQNLYGAHLKRLVYWVFYKIANQSNKTHQTNCVSFGKLAVPNNNVEWQGTVF